METANALARPAFMVQLKLEVPPAQRAAGNGTLFASMTTAQLIGPLLGALVLAPFGTSAVFVINSLTFLGVALAVTRLRDEASPSRESSVLDSPPAPPPDGSPTTSSRSTPTLGYAWLLRRLDLGVYSLASLGLALLVQATIALFIVRAHTLGLGDGGVGIFYAAVAIGSLLGSIIAGTGAHADRATLFRVAIAMGSCSVALAAFGVVSSVALALVSLVTAGFATDFHEVAALTYFQHRLPDAVYGRFFSLFLIALSAGALCGALLGPGLERMVGLAGSLAILAVPGFSFALGLARISGPWSATGDGDD